MDLSNVFLNNVLFETSFETLFMQQFSFKNVWECSLRCSKYCIRTLLAFVIMTRYKHANMDLFIKVMPDKGFKAVIAINGRVLVKSFFYSLTRAPRALSYDEYQDLKSHINVDLSNWFLTEYFVRDTIIDLKSRSSWISKYPAESPTPDFIRIDGDDSFSKMFRRLKNHSPHRNVTTQSQLYEHISQFYAYYDDELNMHTHDRDLLIYDCAFHQGTQLAFGIFYPKIVQRNENSMYIVLEPRTININHIPAVIKFSEDTHDDDQMKFMSSLIKDRPFYGKIITFRSHIHMGSAGLFKEIIEFSHTNDWMNFFGGNEIDVTQFEQELNSICPNGVYLKNKKFLSRYMWGLLASIESPIRWTTITGDCTQFLANKTLIVIYEGENVYEKTVLATRAGWEIHVHNVCNSHGILNRTIVSKKSNPVDNAGLPFKLKKCPKFVIDKIIENVNNDIFIVKEISRLVAKCFKLIDKTDKKFLETKNDVKSLIDGVFHYYTTIGTVSYSDDLHKTIWAFKRRTLLTFIFTATQNVNIKKITIPTFDYIHKYINVLYRKPYFANLIDIEPTCNLWDE